MPCYLSRDIYLITHILSSFWISPTFGVEERWLMSVLNTKCQGQCKVLLVSKPYKNSIRKYYMHFTAEENEGRSISSFEYLVWYNIANSNDLEFQLNHVFPWKLCSFLYTVPPPRYDSVKWTKRLQLLGQFYIIEWLFFWILKSDMTDWTFVGFLNVFK